MAAKKSTKKTTKKTVKKTIEKAPQEQPIAEQSVPQPASKQQVQPQKVVQTIRSLNKMWIVIGVLAIIFIILVGVIFLNTPKTEDVTEEEEPEVEEQVELEVGKNYVLIPAIKDCKEQEVAVQGLIYPTEKVMYGEFNDLIQDSNKNNLYFKPATKQNYVHKELYAVEGTIKFIEVTSVCQRMYICNQNFVNPYNESITSDGWINESIRGLSTPKFDIENCIKEDENINLLGLMGYGQCLKQYRYDSETYEKIYYIDQATAILE